MKKEKVNTNADLILSHLQELGVDYVFGVTGGAIYPLYNALARSERNGKIKAILARHESGAAFMANGYFRETGKLGVCCATTGPGATNLITGVASAYTDGIPMLVITAQTPLNTFGLGAFQESSPLGVDIVKMFDSCTRYNTLISHSEQLERILVDAIDHAFGSRSGPVHISIPVDILRASAVKSKFGKLQPLTKVRVKPNQTTLKQLNEMLTQAKKGVILLGRRSEGAMREILNFAESRQWPIITTPMAKGLISSQHPLYRGVLGLGGHSLPERIIKPSKADVILAVGILICLEIALFI